MKINILLFLSVILTVSAEASDTIVKASKVKFKHYVSLGGYFPSSYTNLRLDSKGFGINFSLEKDFGYKERGAGFNAIYSFQISKRSGLSLSYFAVNKSQSKKIEREITILDSTFSPGALIDSYFNTTYVGLGYDYNIFAHENWNAGISSGIKLLYLQMGIEAQTNSGSYFISEIDAPIPTIYFGLHGSGYLTPKLLIRIGIDYFGLNIEGIKVKVVEQKWSLEYFIYKNISIGGSHNTINYKVTDIPISDMFEGEFEYGLTGFRVFAGIKF